MTAVTHNDGAPQGQARCRRDTINDHATKAVPIGNSLAQIDLLIADDIAKMNARGVRTVWSCQGNNPDGSRLGVAYLVLQRSGRMHEEVIAAARAAGFYVANNDAIYADPHDHNDAARSIAKNEDLLKWNERFRLFIKDVANDAIDFTGQRYRSAWFVHDCVLTSEGGAVDRPMLPAHTRWLSNGGAVESLCHGDLEPIAGRRLIAANARWTIPEGGLPADLQLALTATQFKPCSWGLYTNRNVASAPAEYFVRVTNERLIAMNRAVLRILTDYANDCIQSPDFYIRFVAKEQRMLKRAQ